MSVTGARVLQEFVVPVVQMCPKGLDTNGPNVAIFFSCYRRPELKLPKHGNCRFLGMLRGQFFATSPVIIRVFAFAVKTTTVTFWELVLTALKYVVICVGLFLNT